MNTPALLQSSSSLEWLRVDLEGMAEDPQHLAVKGKGTGEFIGRLVKIDQPDVQQGLLGSQSFLPRLEQTQD